MPEIKLLDIYECHNPEGAEEVLYRILQERPAETRISMERLPDFEEHCRFVRSRPFRFWYFILIGSGTIAGEIRVEHSNAIGISLHEYARGQGYGSAAVREVLRRHQPLPAIPSERNGHWTANIAIGNESSKKFFAKLGFVPLQETWVLK